MPPKSNSYQQYDPCLPRILIVGKLQERDGLGEICQQKIQELYFLTGMPVAAFSENLLLPLPVGVRE